MSKELENEFFREILDGEVISPKAQAAREKMINAMKNISSDLREKISSAKDEEKLKSAFLSYVRLSGLWEDKIKGNLAFKNFDTAIDVQFASVTENLEMVTFGVMARYAYFEPDTSNIIWQKNASFEEYRLKRIGEVKIGESGKINEGRVSEQNFSVVLSIPLLKELCNYFNIDIEMLVTNADRLISINAEMSKANLELERTKESIERKRQEMESIAAEINRDSDLQAKTLEQLDKLRKDFSSIVKSDPKLNK